MREAMNGTTACVSALSVAAEEVTETPSSQRVPAAGRRRLLSMLLALGGVALLAIGATAAIVWHHNADSPPADVPATVAPPPADTHRNEPQATDREEELPNADTRKGWHPDGEPGHLPGSHRPGRFPFHRP